MLVGWSGVSCAEAGTRSGVPSWLPILCPPDSSSASWLNQVPSNACWRPNVTQSSDAVWFGTPDLLSCCFPLSNHVAVVHTFVPDLTTGRCSERLATLVRRCLPCQSFSNCEQNLSMSIFASLTVRMSQQHLALPLDVTASLSETLKFTDQVLLTWWNLFPDFTPAILPFCHSLSGRACVRSFSGLSMFVAVLPSDEFCISHFYNLGRCLLFTFKTVSFLRTSFHSAESREGFVTFSLWCRIAAWSPCAISTGVGSTLERSMISDQSTLPGLCQQKPDPSFSRWRARKLDQWMDLLVHGTGGLQLQFDV